MNLSHFGALLVFSILVSTVFAITTKNTVREQVRYGAWVFCCFLVVAIVVGWIMYPLPF
jgi:hypothetical protein